MRVTSGWNGSHPGHTQEARGDREREEEEDSLSRVEGAAQFPLRNDSRRPNAWNEKKRSFLQAVVVVFVAGCCLCR